MIEMDFSDLVVGLVGGAFLAVILFAILSRSKHAKTERKALEKKAVCRLCLAVFEVDGRFDEHHCPQCHASTGQEGPTPLG
ncbi:putative paraquat-inducible protein A [Haloferula luteola]|uniref:Putative paraquat-inducible protein A n=1 Tax=Haloferula luteola TaxID=595692 RepID=A0A840UYG2_9BACT|nr:hypothetical protein [Haloferula luteola]MBB5350033.1 putative paraquat-inducible protein A [Haloferula luteola]